MVDHEALNVTTSILKSAFESVTLHNVYNAYVYLCFFF